MKILLSGLASLIAVTAGSMVSAQTVVVPAPVATEVAVPVPAPAADSTTTTVKRVTVIPPPVAVPTGSPLAPVTTKTTTTTTARTTIAGVTVSDGVVDVYEPGARFVVREASGPISYNYGQQTVYSTPSGVALTAEQVRTRIRAGLPVRVEYLTEGQNRVIQRVVIDDRYLKD